MVFDPLTDSVHLFRSVVRLLRFAATAAVTRVDGGELLTADERLAEALQRVERITKIRRSADQLRRTATSIDIEADALQTELTRLLSQARSALGGALAEVRDDVA